MSNVSVVQSASDLLQILDLQRANLRDRVSPEEAREQGFVTVLHTLEVLQKMHALLPSIIAQDGGQLIGYALSMTREARPLVPILEPMFQMLDGLTWRGESLARSRYYVMGQICVAKPRRGQGIFDALYLGHRAHYAGRFDSIVTEVATGNQRSMRAHLRVGFELIHAYRDDTDDWAILGWDWRSHS